MNSKANSGAMSDAVQSDVSRAIDGAQDMLAQAAATTGEKAAELRGRAMEQLRALQARLRDMHGAALDKSKAAAYATDDYVHENPWRIIAGAASVGILIGLLIGRRD